MVEKVHYAVATLCYGGKSPLCLWYEETDHLFELYIIYVKNRKFLLSLARPECRSALWVGVTPRYHGLQANNFICNSLKCSAGERMGGGPELDYRLSVWQRNPLWPCSIGATRRLWENTVYNLTTQKTMWEWCHGDNLKVMLEMVS